MDQSTRFIGGLKSRRPIIVWLASLVFAFAAISHAQGTSDAFDPRSPGATREKLEAMAAQAERDAGSARNGESRSQHLADAELMRQRLRDGDFQVGDRILVTVDTGAMGVTDSVTVRTARAIQLNGMPEISLQGVLRSELQDYLTQQYARMIKEPKIKAVPLLRVGIFGPVGKPGFYSVPVDWLLSDVIMHAGGPDASADLNKSVVRRGRKEVVSRKTIQRALVVGSTVDALGLRAGDAIHVGSTGGRKWTEILRAVSIGLALGFTIYGAGKKF
ncbi:MAG: SLBB domain-containing protein [Anaerolineae bacterium]|nr:SLBB domain-containing protein [Gemmatimonadaceae bacterium]